MRCILDTNQAAAVAAAPLEAVRPTIVIPPLVWAEVLYAPEVHYRKRLEGILRYNLEFGMDWDDVWDRIADLTESAIRDFVPVFPRSGPEYNLLHFGFENPTPMHIHRAKQLKSDALQHKEDLSTRLQHHTKEYRDAKSRREQELSVATFNDMEDADSRLIAAENSAVRRSIENEVTRNGTRSIRAASCASMVDAVLDNPIFRRFFRMVIAYDLCYANCWLDKSLNIGNPAAWKNDSVDILLLFYARDGDLILSGENRIQTRLRMVDPEAKVQISTWEKFRHCMSAA